MNLKDATPAQREAIMSDAAEILALAGPGSGKTATLVARIMRQLADGFTPDRIVALTFTNAAANELSSRLVAALKSQRDLDSSSEDPELHLGFVGTLHSFALRMLKEHGSAFGYGDRVSIISPESATDLLASKATSLGCKTPIKTLLEIKGRGFPVPGKSAGGADRFDLPMVVVASYFEDMRAAGIVDYDALLAEFARLLEDERFVLTLANRFDLLSVDEVQDSAPLDWAIYRALPMRSKFLVGDPDQAIYSFRGGRVREMIEFGKTPGTLVVKLEQNFRSREEICLMADRLIAHNRTRLEKRTISVHGAGAQVRVLGPHETEGEEVGAVSRILGELFLTAAAVGERPWPASTSVAVLARTNAIADGFRRALPALGIPVVEVKTSRLPMDWARARALLELFVDPDNDALAFFYSIASYENQGVTPKDARKFSHLARKEAAAAGKSLNEFRLGFSRIHDASNALEALGLENISREARAIIAEKFRELPNGSTTVDLALALADVREYTKEQDGEGVRVLTIHGAKGREFDVVFVVGFEDEACPGRNNADEDLEEERRLAYVAITRARRELYLSSSRTRVTKWNGTQPRTPSRFIAEMHP